MGIQAKLLEIQTKVKAPKNLRNNFGNYNYRNFESICESVKPYLDAQRCTLTVADEIIQIGERFYVKATATLIDCESGETHSVSAYAREASEKKGMDVSQVTGATSSYARKYAVNGLFLLDDTQDTDSDAYERESKARAEVENRRQPIRPSNPISSEQEISNLTKAVEDYIAKGLIPANFIEAARKHIADKNADGLKKVISFCESQKTA